MGIFNKERTDGVTYDGQGDERKGIIDRIKYNGEADDLVCKFLYENLSIGAQLIVNQSQEAVFLKGGAICDIFGPGTHTISANNIPLYNVSVPVRSFGDYGVQITDSSAFLQQMDGTLHLFTTEDVIEQFKGIVVQKLTVCISKFVVQREVTEVKINAYTDEISNF